ncbi:DUF417 family protein [Mycobacterium sp. 1423905.2]|uniref:DUF417 family protein n=1 Tax=Mycobacterium sp. 1423905.2 TaxID=1856859 RepID=UPI0009F61D51|nr:DUF417 family protein [Mycobacterium sp. 1423905.2]
MTRVKGASPNATIADRLVTSGQLVSRYGLVLVLAWIGFGKYVKMESRVLIEHSPLMSWVYDVASVSTVARTLGTLEIVAAILIAALPFSARLCAFGSAMAIVLFLGTLSFLFTTPGVIATHAAGVPVLSGMPGQFLLKDVVLIGVSMWSCGEALRRGRRDRRWGEDYGVESNSITLPSADGAGKARSSKP